jgi:hypothetical protein
MEAFGAGKVRALGLDFPRNLAIFPVLANTNSHTLWSFSTR